MCILIRNRRCREWPAVAKPGKEHCPGVRRGGSFTDKLPAAVQDTRAISCSPPAGTWRRVSLDTDLTDENTEALRGQAARPRSQGQCLQTGAAGHPESSESSFDPHAVLVLNLLYCPILFLSLAFAA